ncbi:MAG: tRNA (guanosine(37)-N1)-methyltransferase TrmD [Bacteroidetes bacterium]|nr:tRNA (guanosine(37)-N1)-methyltransferase TrmD [Bacteroidota bacterium]
MTFTVLSLFPEILNGFFNNSIMAKSIEKGHISYNLIDFREFTTDKHRTCDDAPYGGGAGMVIKPEPLAKSLDAVDAGNKRVIYLSPSGKPFNQKYAEELSVEKELVFICGRYEGIDQRIIDRYVDDEICIGDYVISSGEVAALVIVDAVYRLIEGVINEESLKEESFSNGLLEYPHYTRPSDYCGMKVPDILLSGNHSEIAKWRLIKRLEKTLEYRPDLIDKAVLNDKEVELLNNVKKTRIPKG